MENNPETVEKNYEEFHQQGRHAEIICQQGTGGAHGPDYNLTKCISCQDKECQGDNLEAKAILHQGWGKPDLVFQFDLKVGVTGRVPKAQYPDCCAAGKDTKS